MSKSKFKIRCSAIGQIMTNAKGAITAKQLQTIAELQLKEKLTPKQHENLNLLLNKKNAPVQISDTAKSFVDIWMKEQLYKRKFEFSNKYTEKGLKVENKSIEFLSDYFNVFLVKNVKRFTDNEFITGEPDIILKNEVWDVKNSWDCFTFPRFTPKDAKINPVYYWQGQGYMALTGAENYKLIYVLSDTPENLIEAEAWKYVRKNGFSELDIDTYEMFKKE